MPTSDSVHQKLNGKLSELTFLHIYGRKFRLKKARNIDPVMSNHRYILRDTDTALSECADDPECYIICCADQSVWQAVFLYQFHRSLKGKLRFQLDIFAVTHIQRNISTGQRT